jgi:D-beta-D-heptose 7-phosphate kinase/D-beta-D-heptose 1-phosphate adenosyltransferase
LAKLPFSSHPILVVGDIMCDHYVWGDVERISPEAPVQVLRWEREAHRAGGAANAAMNLAALGCTVQLIGVVGDDEPGSWLLRTLNAARIDTRGVVVSTSRATTLKTRIIGRGQHILRIDREVRGEVAKADGKRLAAAIGRTRGVSAIVCSDYDKGVVSSALLTAIHNVKGDPFVVIDPKGRDYGKYRGASLLTPNEKELLEASKDGDPRIRDEDVITMRAESMMRDLDVDAMLVTRGAEGMDVFEKRGRIIGRTHIPAVQGHEVFDVTGAGDTVAAVVALGVAGGLQLVDAARIANLAAGIVVGKIGTAVADPETLALAIENTPALNRSLGVRAVRERSR